jgi:hypothetical protein
MFDREEFGGVMDRAIAVIIVANGAVKHVVAEYAVKRLPLGGCRPCRLRRNHHPGLCQGRAGPDELSIHLDHACVAGLNRAKLGMITHMRNLSARTFQEIQQAFLEVRFRDRAVNRYTIRHTISLKASSFGCRFETSMNPFYPEQHSSQVLCQWKWGNNSRRTDRLADKSATAH